MSEHHAAHGAHDTHHHISSVGQYWMVYAALMVLTIITVLAYYVPLWLNLNLGAANVIIAMAIATTKASLVCLYFMHLKYDKKFHLVAFLSSLIFLALFLSFTLLDINTREDQPAFAKPLYSGKEIVESEGGHEAGVGEAKPAAGAEAKPAAAGEAKPAGAAKPAGTEAKPAASAEAKPATGATAKPTETAKPAAGAEAKPAAATAKY